MSVVVEHQFPVFYVVRGCQRKFPRMTRDCFKDPRGTSEGSPLFSSANHILRPIILFATYFTVVAELKIPLEPFRGTVGLSGGGRSKGSETKLGKNVGKCTWIGEFDRVFSLFAV